MPGKYTVERDAAWLAASTARLDPLLRRVLPPLAAHKSHAVRAALAKGARASRLYRQQLAPPCRCGPRHLLGNHARSLCQPAGSCDSILGYVRNMCQ